MIFWLLLGLSGIALQLVVIHAMSKGAHRKYPGLFFYLLVLFLTGVADFAGYIDEEGYRGWYRDVYFWNNTARHLAGFVAVVSLYFSATSTHPRRTAHRIRILAGAVLVIVLVLYAGKGSGQGMALYLTGVGRNLSFVTVALNLLLWFALVGTHTTDRLLLLISGGLGLNMTGEAIGQTLIQTADLSWLRTTGNLLAVATHLLCLLIWWKALADWQRRKAAAPGGG